MGATHCSLYSKYVTDILGANRDIFGDPKMGRETCPNRPLRGGYTANFNTPDVADNKDIYVGAMH